MAIFNVTNAAGLTAALAAAKGGDLINLAGGNYGDLSIRDFKPASSVVIRSADPTNPAHFDTMVIRSSQNLTFRGLDIGRGLNTGEADYTQLTAVRDSARIVFDGNRFHGSMDGNPQNDGYGLVTTGVTALTLTNNTFEQLGRGAVLSNVSNMQVSDNRFLDLRSDAVNVDGSQNAVIENNIFQGFYPIAGDHPDAIQVHNLGYDKPLTNLTIRNNALLPGGTGGPQGIWIAAPGTHGFKNIVIENNLLYGAGSYNGIGLAGVTGAIVSNNTVISPTTDDKVMWIRISNSSDIAMTDNVAEDFIIESTATNVRSTGDVNLRLTPSLRNQMANVDTPVRPADLLVPDVGFQLPAGDPDMAPISGVAGAHLRSMLAPIGGQSLQSGELGTGEIDVSRVAALVSVETAPAAPVLPQFETVHETPHWSIPSMRTFLQDWWVAIP